MAGKINLDKKLEQIDSYWDPKIVGELNGQLVKLVKFKGEFTWHQHAEEDELFMVLKGSFEMQFRDRSEFIRQNELIIVPRGVEHCPRAENEVHVMLFEPISTLNTGDERNDMTIEKPEKI